MKILAFIPAYRRRHIARLCYAGLCRSIKEAEQAGVAVSALSIASEKEDAALAESCGLLCVQAPNLPLGRKLNIGLAYAMKNLEWDYIMTLGSDDLLGKGFWDDTQWEGEDSVPWYLSQRAPFFGLTEIAIYDSTTASSKYYKTAASFGAGRFVRRDVIERTWNARGFLWEPDRNRGLDFSSERMITAACGFRNVRLMPSSNCGFPMVLDIKSSENIHAYGDLPGIDMDNRQRAWMEQAFPELSAFKM